MQILQPQKSHFRLLLHNIFSIVLDSRLFVFVVVFITFTVFRVRKRQWEELTAASSANSTDQQQTLLWLSHLTLTTALIGFNKQPRPGLLFAIGIDSKFASTFCSCDHSNFIKSHKQAISLRSGNSESPKDVRVGTTVINPTIQFRACLPPS